MPTIEVYAKEQKTATKKTGHGTTKIEKVVGR